MPSPVSHGVLMVFVFIFMVYVIAVEPDQEGTSSKPFTYVLQIVPVTSDKTAEDYININPPAEYPRGQWSTLRDQTRITAREKRVKFENSEFTGDKYGVDHFSVTKVFGSRADSVFGLWCYNKPMLILVVQDSKIFKAGEILVEGAKP